jgi:transposase-like protein
MPPTLTNQDTQAEGLRQAEFQTLLHEKLRQAVRLTLMAVLEDEIAAYIGAGRYERGGARRDQRNGTYTRDLGTPNGVIEALRVPRTRHGFRTQVFERYQRRQAELDHALAEMFIGGVSQAQVGQIIGHMTDSPAPSPTTVSRVFHGLADEFATWKQRTLVAHYAYLFVDATYFTVIYDGTGVKTPILAAVGIRPDGTREVVAFTTGESENEAAWKDLFADLKQRGVQQIGLVISDGGQAMLKALAQQFPGTPRQRCVYHKMQNILSYIPDKQRATVEPELKAIFYQDSREQADQQAAAFRAKYQATYPTALACLDRDWEACLTFYAFPKKHWRTIRTNNVAERLFEEVKKRSHKMAAPFRNEDSCLLLFFAVTRTLKFKKLAPAK